MFDNFKKPDEAELDNHIARIIHSEEFRSTRVLALEVRGITPTDQEKALFVLAQGHRQKAKFFSAAAHRQKDNPNIARIGDKLARANEQLAIYYMIKLRKSIDTRTTLMSGINSMANCLSSPIVSAPSFGLALQALFSHLKPPSR